MINDKEYLKSLLAKHIIRVVFDKADGTEREMRCTLSSEFLPKTEFLYETSKSIKDDVVNVWDVDKSGWRSFRLDSLKEVVIE